MVEFRIMFVFVYHLTLHRISKVKKKNIKINEKENVIFWLVKGNKVTRIIIYMYCICRYVNFPTNLSRYKYFSQFPYVIIDAQRTESH